MYWYNPKTREMEHRPVPRTDAEAKRVLREVGDSTAVPIYEGLRITQTIEIAMIFAGGSFHLLHTGRRAPGPPPPPDSDWRGPPPPPGRGGPRR